MRRTLPLLLVAVLSAGCAGGGGGSADTAPADTTPAAFTGPAGSTKVEVDGAAVWVDDRPGMRTIYTADCALAERLTSEGGAYGPSPRDPVTLEYTDGYGYLCR